MQLRSVPAREHITLPCGRELRQPILDRAPGCLMARGRVCAGVKARDLEGGLDRDRLFYL
jgi:hypothetical protein